MNKVFSSDRARLTTAFLAALVFFVPAWARQEPPQEAGDIGLHNSTIPRIIGNYAPSSEHPRIFQTSEQLDDLVRRIGRPGSFSSLRFKELANEVKSEIDSNTSWTSTYSGCDLDTYLHAFSYEPRSGYTDENRSDGQMTEAMNIPSGQGAPAGAAVVAAKLALYATLIHRGAIAPSGYPTEQQASELARAILVAWASSGFKSGNGYLSSAVQFCDANGQFDAMKQNNVGLQIARGIVYSAQAQDLLESLGALNGQKIALLNQFHKSMYELILAASNFRANLQQFNQADFACDLYSNHVGAHLLGLFAIARLLDDPRMFTTILGFKPSHTRIMISWPVYFDHAIYGDSESPIACHENKGSEATKSHPYFQTTTAAKGEIEDRYRNASPTQAFSYSMLALSNIYNMATILQGAGFEAFKYVGRHGKSIQVATQYYACFALQPGFGKVVTENDASNCTNYNQYAGDIVTDVEGIILRGAAQYPTNETITTPESAARSRSAKTAIDPIAFGRWRD
jgi:hypothetical protein